MHSTPQQIDEQAAEWMIRLHEGDLSDELRLAFEHWKRQSPQHGAAAERMQEVISQLQSLRTQAAPAKAALNAAFPSPRKTSTRKPIVRALVLAGCLIIPATVLLRSQYPARWLADTHTAPAEWKTLHLPDESSLTLSGASAVNVHFDKQQRRIELLQGEILVDVAHDATRLFVVQTAQGTLRALGTRFVVKRTGDTTILTMLQSRVAAHSENRQHALEVDAGEQALIETDAIRRLGHIDPQRIDHAWKRHQLVVQDLPLSDVLEEIARQRYGLLTFDRAALADLRVSAVLPMDDPERALNLIAETLPISVRHFTAWLIRVDRDTQTKK